jgi:hypothetical protein
MLTTIERRHGRCGPAIVAVAVRLQSFDGAPCPLNVSFYFSYLSIALLYELRLILLADGGFIFTVMILVHLVILIYFPANRSDGRVPEIAQLAGRLMASGASKSGLANCQVP